MCGVCVRVFFCRRSQCRGEAGERKRCTGRCLYVTRFVAVGFDEGGCMSGAGGGGSQVGQSLRSE